MSRNESLVLIFLSAVAIGLMVFAAAYWALSQ